MGIVGIFDFEVVFFVDDLFSGKRVFGVLLFWFVLLFFDFGYFFCEEFVFNVGVYGGIDYVVGSYVGYVVFRIGDGWVWCM